MPLIQNVVQVMWIVKLLLIFNFEFNLVKTKKKVQPDRLKLMCSL